MKRKGGDFLKQRVLHFEMETKCHSLTGSNKYIYVNYSQRRMAAA
jgi:hypothetical protein